MPNSLEACRRAWARFRACSRGGVLVYTAFAVPVLLGFAGLSVDVGTWYVHKRSIQSAADAGALAGALEVMRSGDPTLIASAAQAVATKNGFDAGSGDTLVVNHPPTSGPSAGSSDAVEVIARRAGRRFFSASILGAEPDISARSVAAVDLEDTCVYALNPSARGAVKVSGGATVNLSCGIKVNSTDPAALDQSSAGSCISSTLIKIHAPGWYDGPCVNATEGILTTVGVKDPMALVDPPVDPNTLACDHTAKIKANAGEHLVLDPGVYCNSIETVSTGQITFNPGLYVLHGAALKVSASGSLQGDSVTFYITPNASASDSVNFQAGATVDLTAPDAGEAGMPGVLFYQDRAAPTNLTHHFTAESDMNLEGTMYFPTSQVKFAGGSSLDAKAAMLIADTVSFTGHSYVGEFAGSVIESNPSLIAAILLE